MPGRVRARAASSAEAASWARRPRPGKHPADEGELDRRVGRPGGNAAAAGELKVARARTPRELSR